MSKKTKNTLFFIGMILIIIGFIVPMYHGEQSVNRGFLFSNYRNEVANVTGFEFIKYWEGFPKAAVVMLFVFPILGIIVPFFVKNQKSNYITRLIITVFILFSFISFVATLESSFDELLVYRFYFKNLFIGFYMCCLGVLLSLIGVIPDKEMTAMLASSKQNEMGTQNSTEDELKKLKSMFDEGLITEEEFSAKKAKLLGL